MISLSKYIIGLTLLVALSCEKTEIEKISLASLKVVNAVTSGSEIRLGSHTTSVFNNQSLNFPIGAGNSDIYVWPIEDSLHPYYASNKAIHFETSGIYTLFIGGTPVAPESVLIKEDLPIRTDSTAGIRFINLSPNSEPVNITLSTSPTVNEFSEVPYKGITEFKTFSAGATNTSYTFQVRSVSDPNTVLTSFTLNSHRLNQQTFIPRFRNMTLVFNGILNGTPAPLLRRVNHYNDR